MIKTATVVYCDICKEPITSELFFQLGQKNSQHESGVTTLGQICSSCICATYENWKKTPTFRNVSN